MQSISLHTSSIADCTVITLPKVLSENGSLTAINEFQEINFAINRIYYLYDIPGGEARGGHAHKNLYQLLVAASGSFTVTLFDGKQTKKIDLNRPYYGLIIVPGIWREIDNFSSGSICLVLASDKYDEQDYIRDKVNFIQLKTNGI